MSWNMGEVARVAMRYGTELVGLLDEATELYQRQSKSNERLSILELVKWLIATAQVEVDRGDNIIHTTAEEVKK